MTQSKNQRISLKKAENAFQIAICKINCPTKNDRAVTKCIAEEKGCLSYQVFKTMISK